MTSFAVRDIKESHPNDPSFWKQYLPIAPSFPHPTSGIQLLLRNGAMLDKPSYIRRTCFEVTVGVLAHYVLGPRYLTRSKELRLTKGSLKQLLLHMPTPLPWKAIPTQQISLGPSINSGSQLVYNRLKDSSSAEAIKDLLANKLTGFDVRLTISAHQLDDGTFEELLKLCRGRNVKMLTMPDLGSFSLAPTSNSASVFGPQATSDRVNPVMEVQRNANPIADPESLYDDIIPGNPLDDLSCDEAISIVWNFSTIFTDFMWAHMYSIGRSYPPLSRYSHLSNSD